MNKDPVLQSVLQHAEQIILGKSHSIRLCLSCLISQGHLLIEDRPGMGKTTLAQLLARLFDLNYQRVQFTSDLLPADLLGVSVYDRQSEQFHFHPGPIFSQLILADEINRASPKTQSALLEAMEEKQVSIEGKTRPLPRPFFVIATQNPLEQVGTFPLPESQLDRFLMRISLGFPSPEIEKKLLRGEGGRIKLEQIQPMANAQILADWQAAAKQIYASEALLNYIQSLVQASRQRQDVQGLSPRASLALLHTAKSWAWLEGRPQVLPEDVQSVWPWVTAHRLQSGRSGLDRAKEILEQVIP